MIEKKRRLAEAVAPLCETLEARFSLDGAAGPKVAVEQTGESTALSSCIGRQKLTEKHEGQAQLQF